MPPVNVYKCNQCDLEFPSGWGGYMYVENDSGERIPCSHPGEDSVVKDILGVNYEQIGLSVYGGSSLIKAKWWWSKKKKSIHNFVRQKTGFNSYCLCLDCLNELILDLGDEESEWRTMYGFNRPKDKRLCDKCLSRNVKTNFELINCICPKCKQGKIVEIVTGSIS